MYRCGKVSRIRIAVVVVLSLLLIGVVTVTGIGASILKRQKDKLGGAHAQSTTVSAAFSTQTTKGTVFIPP